MQAKRNDRNKTTSYDLTDKQVEVTRPGTFKPVLNLSGQVSFWLPRHLPPRPRHGEAGGLPARQAAKGAQLLCDGFPIKHITKQRKQQKEPDI